MLAILVPYRDRPEHLSVFLEKIQLYLLDATIVVVEQADDKPFNRGKLLNIGFLEHHADCYCMHDVDMIPVLVDYKECKTVVQLARSDIQKVDYLGGVTMFSREVFKIIEGYHNDYFHRAEDNEQMFNLKRNKIGVINRFGIFHSLPHPRSGPEFIPELWQKAQAPREINMLENCHYDLISKDVYDTHTHIRVTL